jgi:hypothetical protein
MAQSRSIGEMNGKWSILFRIGLVLIPLFVARAEWNSRALSSTFKELGDANTIIDKRLTTMEADHFTSDDGLMVWKEIGNLKLADKEAPEWFVKRLDKLELKVDELLKAK